MISRFSRIGAGLAMVASLSMVATPALADGWRGGWGGRDGYHHRHRDGGGSDAAAIIAGLLVIGGIAAIAASSGKRNRDHRERYGWVSEDTAVDTCASELYGNGDGVDSIDSVTRRSGGWRVEGRTGNGADFTCSVSGSGAVYDLRID